MIIYCVLIILLVFIFYLFKNGDINKHKVDINRITNYGILYKNLWSCPIQINNKVTRNFYSQCNEDKMYYDLYFSKPLVSNGIFVEIGALDGSYSNTLFYEKELGWRGILIEGLPSNCRKLMTKERNRSEIFCTAICPYYPKTVEFYDVWGMGGLKENNPFWNKNKRTIKPTINVTCTYIREIFYSTGITHIDFFSLDVEGAEYMVLDTFDFSIRVHYWVIEFNSKNKSIDNYVIDLLQKNGYKKCVLPKMSIRNECYYDPYYYNKVKKMIEIERNYFNSFGGKCI